MEELGIVDVGWGMLVEIFYKCYIIIDIPKNKKV